MSKGHRDNHKARKKRGKIAFDKKAKRRSADPNKTKCIVCGNTVRNKTATMGKCMPCMERLS